MLGPTSPNIRVTSRTHFLTWIYRILWSLYINHRLDSRETHDNYNYDCGKAQRYKANSLGRLVAIW